MASCGGLATRLRARYTQPARPIGGALWARPQVKPPAPQERPPAMRTRYARVQGRFQMNRARINFHVARHPPGYPNRIGSVRYRYGGHALHFAPGIVRLGLIPS